jgi:uncharacterized protein YebE (UPF0316 family)
VAVKRHGVGRSLFRGPASGYLLGHAESRGERPNVKKEAMAGSKLLYSVLFVVLICFWVLAWKTGGQTESASTHLPLLGALLIFFLRLSDMTLDTLRLTFTMRGHKYLAALVGFMQAAIVVVAIAKVVNNVKNPLNIVAYAAGFAAGIIVGMTLEERMALGYSQLQLISRTHGQAIADALRQAGHAATLLLGAGKDGAVGIIHCMVRRADAQTVKAIAEGIDPGVFVTGEEIRPLARGYFRV